MPDKAGKLDLVEAGSTECGRDALIAAAMQLADSSRNALAILDAIEAGDLLGILPAAGPDAHRHQTAVTLLDLARDRLANAVAAWAAIEVETEIDP